MCIDIRQLISDVDVVLKILLSATTIVGAIVTLVLGGRKLLEMIKAYREGYLHSVFGYYFNLQTRCMELKHELDMLLNRDSHIYNYMDKDDEEKYNEPTERLCGIIREMAKTFLTFLASEKFQIPPKDEADGYEKWMKNYNELGSRLCKCKHIGLKEPTEDIESKNETTFEASRDAFYIKLDIALNYFITEIPNIQQKVISKMPSDYP
ncbi:MAG: hypothetical protein FWG31_02765 [Oscillospiraceae bacterium]|nr:hypothetical protein [Oscillospiraceae bacterium]